MYIYLGNNIMIKIYLLQYTLYYDRRTTDIHRAQGAAIRPIGAPGEIVRSQGIQGIPVGSYRTVFRYTQF